MADSELIVNGGNNADGGGNSQEPRVFTQDELDRILQDRIARERSKYGDYDALKAQADKLKALEDAQKSELDREREARAQAEARAQEAEKAASDRLIQAAFIEAAAQFGVQHARDAFLLADKGGVSVSDTGEVLGVAEAVKALVDAGRLVMTGKLPAPSMDSRAGGGGRPEAVDKLTLEEQAIAAKMGISPEEYAKFKTK
jgi:multidrug efflux pump subunit AcrA (membrane-fusion protein)